MKNSNSILAWLAVGTMTAFLFYQITNSHHGEEAKHDGHASNLHETHKAAAVAGSFDKTTGNFIYNIGDLKEIKVGETTLSVGENSTEFKLYTMLSNADFKVDEVDKTKNWITLDRTYFNTGSSVLTDESKKQVESILAILKAYPTAKIKLGGYTDNKGSEEVNKKVSNERAGIVAKSMVDLGVNQANVKSEGYGSEHPLCEANDTDECRAQNRRVDIKLAVK